MYTYTKQMTITKYDIGDLLDISAIKSPYRAKAARNRAERAVVISVKELKGDNFQYHVLANDAMKYLFNSQEMGEEKYIGRIDLSSLWGHEGESCNKEAPHAEE